MSSVTSLSATVLGTVCTLSWTNPPNNGGVAVQRTLPLSNTQVGGPSNFETLATLPAGTTSYSDSTIAFGSEYVYRVISLPLAVSQAHTQDYGVTISVTISGTQPHLDTTPPAVRPVSFKPSVIIDGSSTNPGSHAAASFDPPAPQSAFGVPFNA